MTFGSGRPGGRRETDWGRAERAITSFVRWLALVLSVVIGGSLGLAPRPGAAAPQVVIRAHTRIALERVKRLADDEVEVTGQLVDKLTSEGIPNQPVTIDIGGVQRRAYTEADGRFHAVFSIPVAGPLPLQLRFDGGRLLERAEPFATVTDPSRAEVTLSIRAEEATGGMRLYVTTTVEDTPTKLPVQLSTGAADSPALAPYKTIDSGTPFLLTRAALGGAGPKRVRATFVGDDRRQQATAETTFELTSKTTTTAKLSDSNLAFEDDLEITGTVSDEDGNPVARAAVSLTSGDRRLAQGATDDDGSYTFEIEAEVLAGDVKQLPDDFGVQVTADPPLGYIKRSQSNPAIVRIAAPQPVPVSYTVAAFLATALAAGGFFTARAKPWRRFRRAAPPADTPSVETTDDIPMVGGLVTNRPGLVSTLRRPHDEGFSGVVRDTVRGRPVDQAVVRVVLGDRDREVRTGPDGTFVLDKLPHGEWKTEVAAPGHITERFAITIPHRGELRGVRVDLIPVRERVFQLYRRAAEPSLPEARLWGIWSPRQIVDHVRAKRESPAMLDLTDFVEEVYFSPRLASETVLPQTSERVDRAIRERIGV